MFTIFTLVFDKKDLVLKLKKNNEIALCHVNHIPESKHFPSATRWLQMSPKPVAMILRSLFQISKECTIVCGGGFQARCPKFHICGKWISYLLYIFSSALDYMVRGRHCSLHGCSIWLSSSELVTFLPLGCKRLMGYCRLTDGRASSMEVCECRMRQHISPFTNNHSRVQVSVTSTLR